MQLLVIENLLIAHIEFRTDDSPDVVPYIFERSLETVVVQLDDMLIKVRDEYIKLLEKYTRVLMEHKVLMGNCSNLTKGKIYMTMKHYQETNRQNRDRNYNEIMKYLNICHTLYYAYELLLRHGLRSFLIFFQDRVEKSMLNENIILHNIIREVEEYMGPLLNIQTLPDGSITGIPETVKFGHPKFYRLRDITCDHFKQKDHSETRVIIFCEYRETVIETYGILSLSQPLIKPRIFMGQSSITQKQQMSVIKAFRDGSCNTLISTCIGEEGIDVGNVDLIICFDISNKSPIRMIQRMGRTGRKREGRIVILVTEGKEQQTLKECLIQKQSLNYHILQSKAFENDLYKDNPRMIPVDLEPKCNKIFITVKPEDKQKPQKGKNRSLKDMFKSIAQETKNIFRNEHDTVVDVNERLPIKKFYWNKGTEFLNCEQPEDKINFEDKINKIRMSQPIGFIEHSTKTNLLVSLLQSCESKKYNIPTMQTRMPFSESQSGKSNSGSTTNTLKQVDIRNMFVKPLSTGIDVITTQLKADKERHQPKHTCNEQVGNYLNTLENEDNNNCKICVHLFNCSQYHATYNIDFNITTWINPDLSIFDNVNEKSLLHFEKSIIESIESANAIAVEKEKDEKIYVRNDLDNTSNFIESPFKTQKNVLQGCDIFESSLPNLPFTQIELQDLRNRGKINKNNSSLNIDEFNSFDFEQTRKNDINVPENNLGDSDRIVDTTKRDNAVSNTSNFIQSPYKAPNSLPNVLKNCNIFNSPLPSIALTQIEFQHQEKIEKNTLNMNEKNINKDDINDILSFFNCTGLEEMWENLLDTSETTVIYSPKSYKQHDVEEDSDSPVLTFNKKRMARRTQTSTQRKESQMKNDSLNNDTRTKTISFSSDEDGNINIPSPVLPNKSKCNKNGTFQERLEAFDISDIVDLSAYGLTDAATVGFKPNLEVSHQSNINSCKSVDLIDSRKLSANTETGYTNMVTHLNNCVDDFCETLCDDSFQKKIDKNINQNVKKTDHTEPILEHYKNELKIVSKSNSKPKVEMKVNNNKQWEKEIWNFCMESDSSLENQIHSNKGDIQSTSNKTANQEHIRSINSAISDVIDLTSDHCLSSPSRSPSLIKSQRLNTQKSSFINRRINFDDDFIDDSPFSYSSKIKEYKDVKNTAKTLLALKKPSREVKNKNSAEKLDNINSFVSDEKQLTIIGSTSKELSPMLNRLEITKDSFNLKKPAKKLVFSDDDDDDFELDYGKAVPFIRPKPKNSNVAVDLTKEPCKNNEARKNQKLVLKDCPYLNLEAEVLECDSDSTEESCFDGSFEKSFVDDDAFLNTTVMHARYLESVKDTNSGKFKIPQVPASNKNVYSQIENIGENTYLNDTFCVNSQDIEQDNIEDLSELEIAELILKEKKRNKRKVKKQHKAISTKKRIIETSSSDSD